MHPQQNFAFNSYNGVVPTNFQNNGMAPTTFQNNGVAPTTFQNNAVIPTTYNQPPLPESADYFNSSASQFGLDDATGTFPHANTFMEGWVHDFMMGKESNADGHRPIPQPYEQPGHLAINQQPRPNLNGDLLDITTQGRHIGMGLNTPPQPIAVNIPTMPPFQSSPQFVYRPDLAARKPSRATAAKAKDKNNLDLFNIQLYDQTPRPPVTSPPDIKVTPITPPFIPPKPPKRPAKNLAAKKGVTVRTRGVTPRNPTPPAKVVEGGESAPVSEPQGGIASLIQYIYGEEEERARAAAGTKKELESEAREAQARAKEEQRIMEERKKEEVGASGQRADSIEWPGDPSEYPVECYQDLQLPGCEFRRVAICVGKPRPGWLRERRIQQNRTPTLREGLIVVFAVPRRGASGVEFRLKRISDSVQDIERNEEIHFVDIELNSQFSGMNEPLVVRWCGYLLGEIPGINNSTTMWAQV
jgi:hypothetical protein